MPGRKYSQNAGSGYRFGVNGQEKSTEIHENSFTAEYWEYDSRLGRRWNIDPVVKPFESSYATFANNPIWNIDTNGEDTLTFTKRTTITKLKGQSDGHSDNLVTRSKTLVSTSGSIDIKAGEGLDVFYYQSVTTTIDENGKESTVSSGLQQFNPRGSASNDYRTGGWSGIMGGQYDDRNVLAMLAPKWLLQHYASKSKGFDSPQEWAYNTAIANQSDLPFIAALQKVTNTAYTIAGVYGIARMTLVAALPASVRVGETSFFAGTRYTNKVWKQMQLGDFHSFPEGVTAFEKYGIRSVIKGGDGIERQMLKIPGSYRGKDGVFEFIKEADGSINHRLFQPFR